MSEGRQLQRLPFYYQLSPRGFGTGPSSNQGQEKVIFFGCTLKQLKVFYEIKNKFVWLKSLFCCKKMLFKKTSFSEGIELGSLGMSSWLPYLCTTNSLELQ